MKEGTYFVIRNKEDTNHEYELWPEYIDQLYFEWHRSGAFKYGKINVNDLFVM